MFDMSADLTEFYSEHVRLGSDRRKTLADCRDLNVERLKKGLDDLAEETGRPHPYPVEVINQGGYAMHTLNQARDNDDYDIDVGLVFDQTGLPEDPLAARQRICNALLKHCTNFSKEPEVRTNAVTVWYADGYHIDFAIYRKSSNFWGGATVQHANSGWTDRHPTELTDWFARQVAEKSPKSSFLLRPTVADGQLRRIVRFMKWFCRSRASWCLPVGIMVTALVVETYRNDSERDDKSLYETMRSLLIRLKRSISVINPIEPLQELTQRDELRNQVKRLRDQLETVLPKLDVLQNRDCTWEEGMAAWDWVFNHEFWSRKSEASEAEAAPNSQLPYAVKIRCDLAKTENGSIYRTYPSRAYLLPKGIALKFSVGSTSAPAPYQVKWVVTNEGAEAKEAGQESWERTGDICWTSTKYRGCQRMVCQIEKYGRVVAKSSHYVKIGVGGKPKGR